MTRIARLLLMAGALHSFSGASAEETPAAAKVAPTDGGDASVYGPIRYDPSGNIYGIGSESGVSSSYSYDPMSRLVTANVQRGGNIQTNTYGYDRYGNRTSVTGASGVTTTYAVNESTNRLEAGADAYAQYDSGGNLTSWIPPGSVGQRHYAYDSLNMIKREQVWTGSMTLSVHHIYTADDERYWTFRENGGANTSTYTIRDLGGKVLREFSEASDGTFSARDYLYRDGLLLAAVTPSAEHHYSLDHLGTPRVVTDANRYKIGEHTYFPFGGEITDDSPTDGPLRFTGHERDTDLLDQTAGALDYMHARFYSSNLARFFSVDTHRGYRGTPQTLNRYAYAWNSPASLLDPDGREPLSPNMAAALQNIVGGGSRGIHVFPAPFLSKGTRAMTIGDVVLFSTRRYPEGVPWENYKAVNLEGVKLMAHEYVHVRQYRNSLFPWMPTLYPIQYQISTLMTGNVFYSSSSFFEKPAYEVEPGIVRVDATLTVNASGAPSTLRFDPQYFTTDPFDSNSIRGFGGLWEAWLTGAISIDGMRLNAGPRY